MKDSARATPVAVAAAREREKVTVETLDGGGGGGRSAAKHGSDVTRRFSRVIFHPYQ